MTKIAMIAAVARNLAIGNCNELIYWLPNDLKRFKQLTTGHTIIMGSNTFRSLPNGALPNRRNIVLSRSESTFEGAERYTSLQAALEACKDEELVFIIGGEMLYRTAIEHTDILYLTEIDDTPNEADAFFPEIEDSEWDVECEEQHSKDDKHAHNYCFVTYVRKS